MRLAGGDDIVLRLVLLEHQPHRLNVIPRVTPVAPGLEVAQTQFLLHPKLDARDRIGNLARDELPAAAWAFMVEQDAATTKHSIAVTVIHRDPVAINLGHAVRTA